MTLAARPVTACLAAVLVLCAAVAVAAPADLNRGVTTKTLDELIPGARPGAGLPTLEDVVGIAPTERPLRADEVLTWLRALADASPRARLVEFGRTHEGRPLVYLAVSDEATIADLDGFKARHLAYLAGAEGAAPGKPVAWMAYGIHGDELSSTDAAAVLAGWLVTGEDEGARRMRDGLLVLIDPCENPDGRARYLAQTTSFAHRTANPDPDDLSHRAVWPWGRGNHYLFDMNRDWFTMVHPESRRSAEITGWLPQLLVDSHEMGANSSYLFPPARHPFNPLLPESAKRWVDAFSADQAAALDARGYPYFSGEWNEEFFPGYGSSWARYIGTVGVLYEMSRTTGTLVRKREGTVRTFGQAVEHQVASSLANLGTLLNNADAMLAAHAQTRRDVAAEGARGRLKAWIFPADDRHPERGARLARVLSDQGIEVLRLGAPVDASDLVDARTGGKAKLTLPVGTLMVRMDQPNAALARVILDPHVPMETVFFQDEREYIEKGKGSRLYDTTAWSLALCGGVPACWTGRVPGGRWEPWQPMTAATSWALPEAWTSIVFDGDPAAAQAALADLLQAGVTVRVAAKPFTMAGHAFGRGSFVIRREGNIDEAGRLAAAAAVSRGLAPVAVTTSRPDEGPDLGGGEFDVLVAPKVGVLTGMPIAPDGYGWIWHLLDQELDLRFTALDVGNVRRLDLARYNVLVFPTLRGGPAAYRQLLGLSGMDALRRWVEAGGTAIGIGAGARFLSDPQTELVTTRHRADVLDTFAPPVWSLDAVAAQDAGRQAATGLRVSAPAPEGAEPAAVRTASPYDVAPLLGPGARPFAEGHDQGTALGGSPAPMDDWLKGVLPPGRKAPEPEDRARADQRLREFMPQGALLRVDLDEELWLNWGLGAEAAVWFGNNDSMIAAAPARTGARFADIERLHLGGLLWPEAAARIAHTGYCVREGAGRGQVVLFADHPVYRRWMAESERMFVNAVLLGPGLGTRWSSPW
jgi:hypothetical protein